MADPFWTRFATPLAERILDLLHPSRALPGPMGDADFIVEEPIDDVLSDGRYVVGGDVLATKGKAALTIGQRVHVLWRRGRRLLILTHQWQRAQGGQQTLEVYGVEELLMVNVTDIVAGSPVTRKEIYFRNDQQVTRLNLSGSINADGTGAEFGGTGPLKVFWGEADDTFAVMALGPIPASTRLRPRFYVCRLSRPEGQPAGGAPVTATVVQLVDMPTFTLPSKYNAVDYTNFGSGVVTTITPLIFPALGASDNTDAAFPRGTECHRRSAVWLTRALTVVMVLPVGVAVGGNQWGDSERITYLFGVESSGTGVVWESPVTDLYRSPIVPAPLVPAVPETERPPSDSYESALRNCSILSWGATPLVVTAWWISKTHFTLAGATVTYSRDGVFLEDGATLTNIQAWHDRTVTVSENQVDVIPAAPQDWPIMVLAGAASAERILLWGRRNNLTPADETTLWLWDRTAGTLALMALGENINANALRDRAQALRQLPARTVYAIAEDSALAPAGAWPAAAERARFTLLEGVRPLDLGTALAQDAAHAGPLIALPAGLTAPEPVAHYSGGPAVPLEARELAYHVVGTIT